MCAVVLAALFGGSAPAAERGTPAPARVSPAGVVHAHRIAPAAAAPLPPAELALQLQALLGQHSVLAADMMRGRLRGDDDFIQSANAALGKNTAAMSQLVSSLYGEQAADQFSSLWTAHVRALFDYARGLADDDASARRDARSTLTTYERNLAVFFADASKGRLPRGAAEAALRMHVDHLLQQADAYAAKDYQRADRIYRTAYTHTFGLGKTLAAALVPSGTAALNAPSWRLRSELSRLLGEHVSLVVATMRAGVTNHPDFAAAAEAVNGNTRDLASAMDSLFGAPAARNFQALWADHVDQLMAYTAGVVKDNAEARTDARAKLGAFEARFASFLGTATGRRLPAETVAKAVLSHDEMLLRGVDAFAAKDFQKAHDITYATYQHMSHLAGQLATAFGATIAARLPTGGARTGHGGMAVIVGRR